jgi:phenylpropionate dioxygenase-like ring-hydroxylating dioxygenase large terminal subunit
MPMLTVEENSLLTQTGPGTPCGRLMRAFWQPAALSEELPVGGAPLPIRLLGEDLVLFRDDQGRPGLLGLHCSHRGADLSYGRLEDGGLRCIYHGWLYDVRGRCREQPGEPAGSTFYEKIRHLAYPCIERAGVVFAYLGPGDPPEFPSYEFLAAPDGHSFASKIFQECNYLQANEGNLDPVHNSFLHRRLRPAPDSTASYNNRDTAPAIEVEETDFGLRLYSVRQLGTEGQAVKLINFILPNLSSFPAGEDLGGYSVNWHVPVDDQHHWKYIIEFRRHEPLDPETVRRERSELTPDFRLTRNLTNRYQQDRDEMQARTFTGMGYLYQVHDAFATEGEAAIQDRTTEHLGYSDRAVVAARQVLLKAIRDIQAIEGNPKFAERSYRAAPDVVVRNTVLPASEDWREFWKPSPLAGVSI